jgi:protein phosphatase
MHKLFIVLACTLCVCALLPTGCDLGANRTSQPTSTVMSSKSATSEGAKSTAAPDPTQTHAQGLWVGRSSLVGNFRNSNDHELDVQEWAGWTVGVVADGIGGPGVGEVGSKRGVTILVRELKAQLPEAAGTDAIKRVIRQAVIAANDELMALGERDKQLRNLGSSVILAVWRPGEGMYVAGLGDCRAYRVHQEDIKQLTVDHNLAQALVERGAISAEQAKTHRFRNVLWKYLGTRESREGPEIVAVRVEAGDHVLLCTPGLTGVVTDEELLRSVRQHENAQQCAESLTALGLSHKSRDNVSCMVLAVTTK